MTYSRVTKFARAVPVLAALALVAALGACSDTWQGVKQDTGDNLQTTGQALDKAGENTKPAK